MWDCKERERPHNGPTDSSAPPSLSHQSSVRCLLPGHFEATNLRSLRKSVELGDKNQLVTAKPTTKTAVIATRRTTSSTTTTTTTLYIGIFSISNKCPSRKIDHGPKSKAVMAGNHPGVQRCSRSTQPMSCAVSLILMSTNFLSMKDPPYPLQADGFDLQESEQITTGQSFSKVTSRHAVCLVLKPTQRLHLSVPQRPCIHRCLESHPIAL